jgi:class 3 adenylate cyclase/tetratricopeptide (TPR) repeat protein
MDFYGVLDQVVDLLRRRGRVTYGALRLQFGLNDEQLAVLKEELIEAQQLARDEEGRILVWTGEADVPPSSLRPSVQHASQPATQEVSLPQTIAPPAASATPDAERRQLTVLFCDVVDSTVLASQLDPEEWLAVVRAYQAACATVIASYEGHVAQYLGDGLLVYLGYPQAHEDDAQRAVRAGLGMVEAVGQLNSRLEREREVRLAVRLGIHTGLVVVGEVGGGTRQEQLALGETPNLAARLQGVAAPNTLVISATTVPLLGGFFACQSLGPHLLKGLPQPIEVYQVLSESTARSRLEAASRTGLTPLVGREQEVGLLMERWGQAKDGLGQVVVVSGEAGIGKSRLVQVVKERLAGEPHVLWECRGSPYYQNTALYPVIDLLQRVLRFQRNDAPEERLGKLEEALATYQVSLSEIMPLLASLLSLPIPAHYPPLTASLQRQRQQTLDAILTIVLALASQQPVLLIVEDLHWVDPSALELLGLLIDQTPTARILTLLTCRPEFRPSWPIRAHVSHLTLSRLPRPHVEQMVERVTAGKPLPVEVTQQVVVKTDGVPLFVEELTKMVLESGWLREREGRYELTGPLPPLAIPATLHDSLMARLDRLAAVKEVAQLGSTLGRAFPYELLQAVSPLDEGSLQEALAKLVDAELLYQRGVPPQATYLFKHALIQDTAYQSLLKSTRQQAHKRIAGVLEARFAETVEAQPELLAHHYTEAGLSAPAVTYWQRAGERAIQRSANVEAIAHLTTGLEVLKTLPVTPERRRQELDLYIALGAPMTATKGWGAPEVKQVYTRARALCREVGETRQLARVLYGLWNFYEYGGELLTSQEVAEELLHLAQRVQDTDLLLQAHRALGGTLFWCGALVPALAYLEQGMVLYDAARHRSQAFHAGHSAAVALRSHAARSLWPLGYPARAMHRNQEALTLAQEVSHPASLAYAHAFTAMLHQLRREGELTRTEAEAAMALSHRQGLPQHWACAMILRGWALTDQGHIEEGMAEMRQGLDTWRRGAQVAQPYWLALWAEAYRRGGRPRKGSASYRRRWRWWKTTRNVTTRPSSIGSRVSCC